MSGAGHYDLGIRLSCENLVSRELTLIMLQATRLHDVWGKMSASMKMLSLGGLGVAGGVALFKGLEAITNKAKELSHELVQIQKLGISQPQFEVAKAAAYAIPGQVPGTTSVDALKIYGQTYSMFGADQAVKMMKPLAEFAQVIGNTTGNYGKAMDSLNVAVRSGDLLGKFIDEKTRQLDTSKLQHFLDLTARIVASTHGRVSVDTMLGLAQQGGPAFSAMSDEGLMSAAMAAQGMGGMRTGTATTALWRQFVGGRMFKPQGIEAEMLGLIGHGTENKGGHMSWDAAALDTPYTRALKEDPLKAANILMGQMAKHGITEISAQIAELFKVMGTGPEVRIMSDYMRNYNQMFAERKRMEEGLGVSGSQLLQNSEDYVQVMHNFDAAWTDMMAHVGLPMTKAAIPVIKQITEAFGGMAKMADAYPDVPKYLWNVGMGLSALMVAGGTVAIFTGAIGALGGLPLVATAAAIGTIGYALNSLYQSSKSMTPKDIENSIKNNNAILDAYSKKLFGMTGFDIGAALGDPEKWRHAAGAAIAGIPIFFDTIREAFKSGLYNLGVNIKNEIDNALMWSGPQHGAAAPGTPWNRITPAIPGTPEKHSSLVPAGNRQVSINIPVTVMMDGRKLASAVTNQMVASATYPRTVGGMDTRSMWAGPSYQPYEQG